MTFIGIIGARIYKDRQSVIDLVNALPIDSIVVTSACRGVCTWAGESAKACGLTVKTFSPDLANIRNRYEMVERYYRRNRQLIAACDIVHAFISQEAGLTGGTKFEIQYAKRLGKEIILHWENSIVQRVYQKSLPFGSEVNDLSSSWLNFFSEALG
jgi:hypothetical protein